VVHKQKPHHWGALGIWYSFRVLCAKTMTNI
jgi:hypothetical protein